MNLSQRVASVVDTRLNANKPVWDLIDKVKNDRSIGNDVRRKHLLALYNCLSDKDLQQRNANDSLIFDVGTSFRSSINDLRRTKQRMRLLNVEVFPGGNPKLRDRAFAKSLGVPVPETYLAGVPLHEIELRPRAVLKPEKGAASRGVFYIDESLSLHSMKTGREYFSRKKGDWSIRFNDF